MTKKSTKKPTKNIRAGKAVANVSKQNQDGSVEDEVEQVGDDRMFIDPPCNVGYNAGVTLPFPENRFSNAKFGVSIHIPCTHDEINETYDFAVEWVEERMQNMIDDFHEE